jgi:hypothetical protein
MKEKPTEGRQEEIEEDQPGLLAIAFLRSFS